MLVYVLEVVNLVKIRVASPMRSKSDHLPVPADQRSDKMLGGAQASRILLYIQVWCIFPLLGSRSLQARISRPMVEA